MNPEEYRRGPHPIFILGIITFVTPVISNICNFKLPGWVSGIGIVLILIGGLMTAFDW